MTVWTVPAMVTRVIDGDTLVADLDLGWGLWRHDARVRLDGINCPEMDTEAGRAARAFARVKLGLGDTVVRAEVTLVSRSLDKYGRTLAGVRLADGTILNDLLLEAGHAMKA